MWWGNKKLISPPGVLMRVAFFLHIEIGENKTVSGCNKNADGTKLIDLPRALTPGDANNFFIKKIAKHELRCRQTAIWMWWLVNKVPGIAVGATPHPPPPPPPPPPGDLIHRSPA